MSLKDAVRVPKSYHNKKDNIWHGEVAEHRFGAQDSIGSVALKSLLENPDQIAQICYQSGREFTNRELLKLSIQVAQHFERLQLEQCDIVGLCAANSDYVAPLFFGAMLSGLCISTLDRSYHKEGIKHIYSLTRPRIMFCDGDNYPRVREAFEECGLSSSTIYTVRNHIEGVPSVLQFFDGIIQPEDYRAPSLKKSSDQLAVIICTSGTVGIPKSVPMSHAALLHCKELDKLPVTRLLCFSSLHWLSGFVALIQGTIDGATRIISEQPFNAEDFRDIVKRYKVNFVISPPSEIALSLASDNFTECDLSSIEVCYSGGSAVPYYLIEKFKRWALNAKVLVQYGMSEICSFVTSGDCEPANSVGKLNANMEVKIVDDDGKHLGPHSIGEICLRSKFPWAGYFKNPEATKEVYDDDGWIHSCDMGYFNDDGQLFVVDRKADIRKYNNFHFSPSDIERVINALPQIADVCVVGLADSTHGFLPAAAVIKLPGCSIEETQIYQHVADRMQDFEQLRGGIYFFDGLPKTVSGKTLRSEVTKLCETRKRKDDQ